MEGLIKFWKRLAKIRTYFANMYASAAHQ